MNSEIKELNKEAEKYSIRLNIVLDEVKKVIVGQDAVLEKIMIALIADGHVLLESVPGLAKTLMVKTFSDTIGGNFARIQFTPDLLPADITGTKIYDHNTVTFSTKKGPIFNNFILADEINRAPPKVQSALLEAMQERQVSIQGDTHKLSPPFLVLATQNPVETEGTYRLPEAQVDRFMFKLLIGYPTKAEEKLIIQRNTKQEFPSANKVISTKFLLELQKFCRRVYTDDKIEDYVASIVEATRFPDKFKCNDYIEYGASPRASIWLIMGAKAHALLNGRAYVLPEDVQAVAYETLRHRIILTYEAEAEDITPDSIVKKILDKVKVP